MHHDTSFPLYHAQQQEHLPTQGPPSPPPSPRSRGGAREGNPAEQGWCCRLGTRGDGQKGDGVLDVRASSCRSDTGHQLCCSNAGGRHGALGAAPSTRADPVLWGCRVLCTRNPALVLPFGSPGRTAMHRALCAVLGQLQPSGLIFWEWCLEETEQSGPSVGASALARSAREDGVPSDTPHPASPRWLGEGPAAPHCCKGRAHPGELAVFAKGDQEKPPLYRLSSSCPLPAAQAQPGHAPQGWGAAPRRQLPPAAGSSLASAAALASPEVLLPSLCLGDSSDFTVTAAVWPEQREGSNVQSSTAPPMRKPPQGRWGKLRGAVSDKVGLEPNTAASQR